MIDIARAHLTSTATPRAFFDRWCDLETHPEWAASMEFFRLDDPFGVGTRGTLKVRGGHEAPFVVTECVDGRSYADTTILDGADLTVHHEAVETPDGTEVVLRAWLIGPRESEMAAEMSAGVQEALDRDLRALADLLERSAAEVA